MFHKFDIDPDVNRLKFSKTFRKKIIKEKPINANLLYSNLKQHNALSDAIMIKDCYNQLKLFLEE